MNTRALVQSFAFGRRGIVLAGGCLVWLACGALAAAKTTITDYLWSDLNTEQQAADLTPLMQRDGVPPDDFLPGAWVYSRYKGAYYGLPRATIGASFAAQLYVYNRTLFDQAGLAYPPIGWTFDAFSNDAKALTRDANGDGAIEQWGAGLPDLDGRRLADHKRAQAGVPRRRHQRRRGGPLRTAGRRRGADRRLIRSGHWANRANRSG